jgi:aryl-alcohol dehydrogenase-like predicted oxidoreductase
MERRTLGTSGLEVSMVGLGCMGMTYAYASRRVRDEVRAAATIDRALELGITFFDTADVYGPETNEDLLRRALAGRREKVQIATKFGFVYDDPTTRIIDGRPEHVLRSCEGSLRRLGVEILDLYYLHRVDPEVPVEETVGAMAQLVEAGKVRHLGLCEVSPATLRRAAAVHPIAAVQSEFSLWTRDPEVELLPTLRELGVGLVAYSPLGRGFLTGAIKNFDDLLEEDWRRHNPRFTPENLPRNLEIVERLEVIAEEKMITPAQLALAWILTKGDEIVPIPGTTDPHRLAEDAAATEVQLSQEDLALIEEAAPPGAAFGARYPEEMMRFVNK